jgi:hypothetical protein
MAQIQQNQYLNPFAYFANTPLSIEKRKRNASKNSNMKIVDFIQNPHNNSFTVLIKGNRGITYNVFFSEQSITCSCPDFLKHTVQPICKHMFKLICLSENHDIFNNSMLLTDLMNPQHLERILTSIMRIIDIKKMERYGGPQNPISIERDEYCPICYGDFDENISQCSKCKHVFHTQCVRLSWDSALQNSRGKCPMCRAINSFPQLHGGNGNYDPWEIYNFLQPAPAPVLEEQVGSDIPIENPPAALIDEEDAIPQPQPQPQHDLVEENNDDSFPNNDGIPQNEDANEFFLPEPVEEPEMAHNHPSNEDGAGQPPNENPDEVESISISSSQSEEEDYDIIDRRIKILNISLFIIETIKIIFNQILYPQELPE